LNKIKLDKDKKYFVIVGIPAFIFIFYVILTHYIQFSIFFLIVLIVVILGSLRKHRIWLRLTKVGLFMVILYLIIFNNIILLPNQLARRAPGGRQNLLEPDNENIKEFRKEFEEWHIDVYNISFDKLSEDTREDLELKLLRVDYYIRQIRTEYTNDYEAPYYYYDYIPTIDEIFNSDSDGDGLLQDDCDGLSILTASLLLNMGYRAFISECEWHWHTLVFPKGANPRTKKGFDQAIYLYNPTKRPAYFIFNETDIIIPPHRPIYLSAFEIFTGERTYTKYYIRFIEGYYFNVPFLFSIFIVYIIFILLSLGILLFVKIGLNPKYKNKRKEVNKILRITFLGSLVLSITAFIIYWFTISGLAFLCNLIACVSFVFLFKFMEKKYNKS